MQDKNLALTALPAMVFTLVWIAISLLVDGLAWYLGIIGGLAWFVTTLLLNKASRR